MFLLSVSRSKIFEEFTPEERVKFFALKEKKVCQHIDTFYYSVEVKNDKTDNEDPGLLCLVSELASLKDIKMLHPDYDLDLFGFDIVSSSFSIYQYHLCLPECFDIFIAKNIPNADTPRICVQLRSRYLVLEGTVQAIIKSFEYVKKILNNYELEVKYVTENRIDYAYHTNLIQSSMEYFSDEYLFEHLKSQLRLFHKIGNISSDEMEINTLQLGNRKSNNVFFRAYNKTREVIEKNYKGFFFKRWLDNELISYYDFFCLERAFELKSYTTGLLVGRMEWYLKYGKNEELKQKYRKLIETCYVNADNAPKIEKELKGVLPEVTIITNIEFQTKRRFYASSEEYMNQFNFVYKGSHQELYRLMKILSFQKSFCEYLTDTTVSFIDSKEEKPSKQKMCDWWKRIHSCKIEYCGPTILEVYRSYDRDTDLKRSARRLKSCIAQFNIVRKNNTDERTFDEDCRDMLSYFNDNDFYGFGSSPEGIVPIICDNEYPFIRNRKARQYRGIIKNKNNNENEEVQNEQEIKE